MIAFEIIFETDFQIGSRPALSAESASSFQKFLKAFLSPRDISEGRSRTAA